jgi:hypothetical protein
LQFVFAGRSFLSLPYFVEKLARSLVNLTLRMLEASAPCTNFRVWTYWAVLADLREVPSE